MIMNTKDKVFGVVEKHDENYDYQPIDTPTIDLSIDNENRTIKGDVIVSSFLGTTRNTAYPGHQGQQNRSLLIQHKQALDDLQESVDTLEYTTKQKIETVNKTLTYKIESEVNRAKQTEEELDSKINAEVQRATTSEKENLSKLEAFKNISDTQFENIENSISQVEQKLQDDLNELQEHIKDDIDKSLDELENTDTQIINLVEELSNNISSSIDNIEDLIADIDESVSHIESEYADKTYVYEQLVEFSTLSKQLVDDVDTDNNTVTINGNIVEPIDGVLYLLKDLTVVGQDIYKEYTTIDDVLTLIGDTSVDLKGYAKIEDIPDVSEFITAIPSEYITESELDNKNYCTLSDVTTLLNTIEFIDGGNAPMMII